MVVTLFYQDLVGLVTIIVNAMTNKRTQSNDKLQLQKIVDLLKFAITLNDEEITKSTVESVIELLEEEINK